MRYRFFFFLLCGIPPLLYGGCRGIVEEAIEQEAAEKIHHAQTALAEEEWEEANELFYEATTLDPSLVEGWVGRGMALTRLGELEAAREHYEEALRLLEDLPAEPQVVRKTIMVRVLLNESETAREEAESAADQHPGDEFFARLPLLVDEMEVEFSDMILPAEDEPQG